MSPIEFQRYDTLRKAARDRDLSDAEDVQLYRLGQKLRAEIARAMPRPQCCPAMKKWAAIWLRLAGKTEDSSTDDAVWRVAVNDAVGEELRAAIGDREWSPAPAPCFCPFCGTALPKMVRKAVPPQPLCRVTDGGYYCDTCEERLDACACFQPESAFEPAMVGKGGE